eukprot:6056593-Amphidinium_carterae.1
MLLYARPLLRAHRALTGCISEPSSFDGTLGIGMRPRSWAQASRRRSTKIRKRASREPAHPSEEKKAHKGI